MIFISAKRFGIERLPVEGELALHPSRLENRLHNVAAVLGIAHDLGDLVRRLAGRQFTTRLKA
jgi:hypothetical protein